MKNVTLEETILGRTALWGREENHGVEEMSH